jgi:[acyl-carrier-protein] S-malonyltransferase
VSSAGPVGLLFPGQGSQVVGMGKDLADAFSVVRWTFEEADDALGIALSRLCWEGPESELTLTVNAQPALLVHSIAVWRLLEGRQADATIAAGHSLGEFSAYVAAGSLRFADAVRTVRRRGELMLRSGEERPGTMAAVLGLDDAVVETVCDEVTRAGEGVVVPANYNAPGQLVISGDVEAVRRAEEPLKEAGARRVVPLNVSGAFHSPLMAVAEGGLREQLESVALADPAFPVVSNVTAEGVTRGDEGRDLLVRQLTSPVRWVAAEQAMLAGGTGEFWELGAGSVLAGLLKRVDREVTSRSLGTVKEIDDFLGKG